MLSGRLLLLLVVGLAVVVVIVVLNDADRYGRVFASGTSEEVIGVDLSVAIGVFAGAIASVAIVSWRWRGRCVRVRNVMRWILR